MQYACVVSPFILRKCTCSSYKTWNITSPKDRTNKIFITGVQPPEGSYLRGGRDIMDCVIETFVVSVILYMDEEFICHI